MSTTGSLLRRMVTALGIALATVAATPDVAAGDDGQASVVIVLDTSLSMRGERLELARETAATYLRALPADVSVGLVTFDDQAELTVPLTLDHAPVRAALRDATLAPHTRLYDAVALAADTLADSRGRRKLLVVSDGEDTGSAATLAEAVRALRSARGIADVGVLGPATDGGRDRLAHATGGRLLTAAQAKARATELAPAPLAPAPSAWPLAAGLGAMFLGLFGACFALFRRVGRARTSALTATLRLYQLSRPQAQPSQDDSEWTSPLRHLLAYSERILSIKGWRNRVTADLDLAGLSLRPAEWLLVRAGISTGCGVLLMAIGLSAPGFALGLLLGWLAGRIFVKLRISRRQAAFAEQLPDTLQLVVGALRAGFSLPQALDAVVRDDTQPIAGEMSRALARTRLGVSVEDVLDKIAERMDSKDFAWVAMAIRIQRRVGGNLAELLATTVHTMRERTGLRRHVKALTAEGKMSAYVLIGLPIVIGLWMSLARREYIAPLYTNPVGWIMLGSAIGSVAVGWFWMSRLVKVEV